MSNTSPHTSSLNNADKMMLDYLTTSYIIGCGSPKDDLTQEAMLLRLQILTYLDSLSEKEFYNTISAGIYSCASYLRKEKKQEALNAITKRKDKATNTYIYNIVENGGTLYGLEFEDYLQEVCLKITDQFLRGNYLNNDPVNATLKKLPSCNRDLRKATKDFLTATKEEWDIELTKADFTEEEFNAYAKEECEQKLKKFKEIVKSFQTEEGYADKVWGIFLYNLSTNNWHENSIEQFKKKIPRKERLFKKEATKYLEKMYKEWEDYLSKNNLTDQEFQDYLKNEIPEAVKTFRLKVRDFNRTSMIQVLDNIIFNATSSVIGKKIRNWKDKEVDWDEYISTKSEITEDAAENLQDALERLKDNLNEEERGIFDLKSQGYSMKEIEEKMGLKKSTAYNRNKRIEKKAEAEKLI